MASSTDKFQDTPEPIDGDDKTKTLQRKPQSSPVPQRQASFSDIGDALRSDPLWPKVLDVVYWRDPVTSGLVLAIISLGWFLVSVAEYSLLTLAAYLYLILIGVSFGLVQYSNFSGKPHPLRARLGQLEDIVTQGDFTRHAESAHRLLDAVTSIAREGLWFHDVVFSLKVLGLALLAAILGNYVSIPTLVFAASLVLFVVPRVYEERRIQIDELIGKAQAVLNEKLGPILAKVPLDKIKLKQD